MLTKDDIWYAVKKISEGPEDLQEDYFDFAKEVLQFSQETNDQNSIEILEAWMMVYDKAIEWFFRVNEIYRGKFTANPSSVEKNLYRSKWSITAKILGDMFSIRILINSGFDVQANILMRSTLEYMEILIAISEDVSLAEEFVNAQTPEETKTFWHQHLARGGLQKRIQASWFQFFEESESPETAEPFIRWMRGRRDILAGLSHPSYMGGILTARPLSSERKESNINGLIGRKTDGSVETIQHFFSHLLPVLLFIDDAELISIDEIEKNHKSTNGLRRMLFALILNLCNEAVEEYVTPNANLDI